MADVQVTCITKPHPKAHMNISRNWAIPPQDGNGGERM